MTTEPKASLGGDEPKANAPEPFMYAYECIEDGRWQAYRQQLKRADGSICPGKPLYAAPVSLPAREEVLRAINDTRLRNPIMGAFTVGCAINADILSDIADAILSLIKGDGRE